MVEVLVVVVILAILAAIAIPIFVGQKVKAERGVVMTKVATTASLLANARAVGGEARVVGGSAVAGDGVEDGVLEVFQSSEDTGPMTYISLGDGIVVFPAFSTRGVVDDFCVQGTSGGVSYHMDQGDSEPSDGVCP